MTWHNEAFIAPCSSLTFLVFLVLESVKKKTNTKKKKKIDKKKTWEKK